MTTSLYDIDLFNDQYYYISYLYYCKDIIFKKSGYKKIDKDLISLFKSSFEYCYNDNIDMGSINVTQFDKIIIDLIQQERIRLKNIISEYKDIYSQFNDLKCYICEFSKKETNYNDIIGNTIDKIKRSVFTIYEENKIQE